MKLDRSWTDKSEHRFLSWQLVKSSGSGFRTAVLPLLRAAFHETALAWWPGSLPELGEDHIVWGSGEDTPLVTACLAFSVPELGEEEVHKVQEVIRRFAGSAVRTAHYLLVHNCESRSREAREAITAELQRLISAGRADRVETWNRQRLLGEAFNGMVRHTWASLQRANLSTTPLKALKEEAGFVPLEEVPCDLSLLRFNQHQLLEVVPQAQGLIDPAATILDPKGELLTLVTGEFGQGKTTSVARAVTRETRPILYVAGARISKETVGKKDLLQQCIDQEKLFAGFPLEDHPTLQELARPVIEYLLQDAESQSLVIIDGLDESAFLARRGGLQGLFNILQEVRSPIVLTMRSEFWEREVESFATAFGTQASHQERRNRKIRRIDLLAWGDDRIQTLIERYWKGASNPASQAHLDALANLIDRGELSRLYGDIPRRPLFLRLLLDTVAEEGLPATGTGRARLLYHWAHRKLYRDIQAPFAAGGSGRLPILSEDESDARAVEIAWEAMLQAARAMIEDGESRLELAADCTLDEVRQASPELTRIEEPLGIFLNSLLLPARPVPRGLPLRIRFAHRAFQEFFLAWFALIYPERLPSGTLPEAVRDWMTQIQAEGLLPAPSISVIEKVALPQPKPSGGTEAHSIQGKTTPPPDLEMRVRTLPENGRTRLSYTLRSSSGAVSFFLREIAGPTIQGNPEEYHARLLQKLRNLAERLDVDRAELLQNEIGRKLASLGRQLWRELFPPELQQVYRDLRQSVKTWLLVSDEPWIPWELIKPFDASRTDDIIDDDFLALRFELTRWLAGDKVPAPAPEIRVHHLAVIRAAEDLPQSGEELSFLAGLAVQSGVETVPQAPESADDLLRFLEAGDVEALHFLGHGRFIVESPDDSPIPFPDGSLLRPGDLDGPLLIRIGRARPLVVLNACWGAQQGWSLTRIGGWASRWVGVAGCGAFISPLWPVRDKAALAFTRAFYEALARGATLGQAGREARQHLRETRPGDPSALAYVVYGHPNARVLFGDSAPTLQSHETQNVSPAILSRILSFDLLISRKTEGFVGRKWLFDDIDRFVRSERSGYVVVLGEPGIGKTAMMAEMVKLHGHPHHFNVRRNGIRGAHLFLSSLCAQLIGRFGLEDRELPKGVSLDSAFLSSLLERIAARLKKTGEHLVMLVDALDESEKGPVLRGANPLYLPVILPDNVFFVVSSRPTMTTLSHHGAEHRVILDQEEGNRADIRLYLESWLPRDGIRTHLAQIGLEAGAFVDQLAELSQGNFMYLSYVLPEIDKGVYRDRELPAGLERYYEDHWNLLQTRDRERWFATRQPILGALAAARGPVGVSLLAKMSRVSDPTVVLVALEEWKQFIEIVPQPGSSERLYQLYHESFRDFLEKKIDLGEASRVADEALWEGIPEP